MPSQLIKIESTPDLVDQVYRSLLNAISDGSLAPGARITQEEIAAQLAVSRQPVLQALRLLKTDGFLQDAPGRGVLVAPLDAQWLTNVYQVRSAIDALAARLASSHQFKVDARLIDAGRKAAKGKNIMAMIDADLAFHTAIYRAAGNPLIEASAQPHWRHIRRAMGAALQVDAVRDVVWDEHEAIARAMATGDAAQAERLMQGHCSNASQRLAQDIHQHLSAVLSQSAKRQSARPQTA
jgi:DNA-binding GntR family transcriptional regulator